MKDDGILSRLRSGSSSLSAVEVANLLDELTQGRLSQSTMIFSFKRAFPSIPLGVLLRAGAWHRVSGGGLDDDGFNDLLRPWFPGS